MKRRSKPKGYRSPCWECDTCLSQVLEGAGRCPVHNPTPEQRAAAPAQYRRELYAPARKKA